MPFEKGLFQILMEEFYETIKINNEWIMAENLAVTKLNELQIQMYPLTITGKPSDQRPSPGIIMIP
ncbi:MAG: hypothetical protein R2744_05415 [Bacteroidales bacterium]